MGDKAAMKLPQDIIDEYAALGTDQIGRASCRERVSKQV